MAKRTTQSDAGQNVFRATLARFAGRGESRNRSPFSGLRKMPLLHRFAPQAVMELPDPVLLAIFAIDRVGPAAVRACASGVEVLSQHPTKQPPQYFAPRSPKRRGDAAPTG